MKRKNLFLLVLFASFFSAGIASAYPFTSDDIAHWPELSDAAYHNNTMPQFMGAYAGPTYYTFAGHDKAKNDYNATIYIDPTRDLEYYRKENSPYQTGRAYYAEYVSGNIFGNLSNLVTRAGDNFDYLLGGGMEVLEGHDRTRFGSPEYHAYDTYIFSSLHVGDWIDVTKDWDPDYRIGLQLVDVQTSTAPVPEPATCLLFASGLAGFGLLRKRIKS
ncbi:PEP-CTERM sorting domain-containing protein [Geotalea toluenoxydans]|uniref:PEP-CTERM sorting domain-containing protein n=1 Tax=Geotalea toluenoxydans TaxID=421624 RepID=UPI0006CF8E6B|nr:PEP-CTERM sorting domain-containing protein [Geotalea toluenoxydans]